MATRKSSRGTKPPPKLKEFVVDGLIAESTTPQQMSEAVKRELSQLESIIKDHGRERQNDRRTSNQNLQLELDLTRTKLKLLKLQRVSPQPSVPKIAAATTTTTSDDNPIAKPTLKRLQQDPTGANRAQIFHELFRRSNFTGFNRRGTGSRSTAVRDLYLISLVPFP